MGTTVLAAARGSSGKDERSVERNVRRFGDQMKPCTGVQRPSRRARFCSADSPSYETGFASGNAATPAIALTLSVANCPRGDATTAATYVPQSRQTRKSAVRDAKR